jgi:hypothetical protein
VNVEEWRKAILRGWEIYGTGQPLDPRTVEYLAVEFSKPLALPLSPYWHGKDPVCELMAFDLPWRPMVNPVSYFHQHIFIAGDDDKNWRDGSCRVTALVKESSKSIVKWEPQ